MRNTEVQGVGIVFLLIAAVCGGMAAEMPDTSLMEPGRLNTDDAFARETSSMVIAQRERRRQGGARGRGRAAREVSPVDVSAEAQAAAALYNRLLIAETELRDREAQGYRILLYTGLAGRTNEEARRQAEVLATRTQGLRETLQVRSATGPDYRGMNLQAAESSVSNLCAGWDQWAARYGEPLHTAGDTNALQPPHASRFDVLNRLTYVARVGDHESRQNRPVTAGSFYSGTGNWNAFSRYGFDAINPHPSHYDMRISCPAEGRLDFVPLDGIIRQNRDRGYRTDIHVETAGEIGEWIRARYGKDFFWEGAGGDYQERGRTHGVLNIWNPDVIRYLSFYLQGLGQHCKGNPDVLVYELLNEPIMVIRGLELGPQSIAGYGSHAERAFRAYLQRQYGSVTNLNRVLRTTFSTWDSIHSPVYGMEEGDFRPAPLLVEFGRFRQDSFVDYFRTLIRELHAADPTHPVVSQYVYNLDPERKQSSVPSGVDLPGMFDLPWDAVGIHDWARKAEPLEMCLTYGLNRYPRHVLWCDELIWNAPEGFGGSGGEPDQIVLQAACARNIWRQLFWGKRGLNFYVLDTAFRGWNNNLMAPPGGNQVMRAATTPIALIKRKAPQWERALFESEIENSQIGILFPSATLLVPGGVSTAARSLMDALGRDLLNRQFVPFFVPEEKLISGQEDLRGFRVLFLPGATHLGEKVEDQLRAWVQKGGVLVSIGPAGVFDPLGFRRDQLLPSLGFGATEWTNGAWCMNGRPLELQTKTVAQGRAYVGPERDRERILGELNPVLESVRSVRADSPEIELMVRRHVSGTRYVCAVNRNPAQGVETIIRVRAESARVADVLLDRPAVLVPASQTNHIVSWATRFQPGEGLIFSLR